MSAPKAMSFDFRTITEEGSMLANREQRAMAYLRYQLAAELAAGGRYVEVACGSGYGLPFVARSAAAVIGGDLMTDSVLAARRRLGRPTVVQLDAQALPFREDSVDAVSCLEAIYYLPDAMAFLREARRILRRGGRLLVTAPNPDRPGFNPSPGSVGYFRAADLHALLVDAGFSARVWGAFASREEGIGARGVELARRLAVRSRLVPKTMKGKELVKRLVFRDVRPLESFDVVVDPHALLVDVEADSEGVMQKLLVAVGTAEP